MAASKPPKVGARAKSAGRRILKEIRNTQSHLRTLHAKAPAAHRPHLSAKIKKLDKLSQNVHETLYFL